MDVIPNPREAMDVIPNPREAAVRNLLFTEAAQVPHEKLYYVYIAQARTAPSTSMSFRTGAKRR